MEAEGCAIYSYAIIETFALALERSGDTDSASVCIALHDQTFETAMGSVKVDSEGG